jgi:hypothetical protein
MKETKTYENFPSWMVLTAVVFSFFVYALGAYILSGLGLVFLILYLCYCLFIEVNLMRRSCVNCYYYGKFCGLGRGRLCSFFFKKGDPEAFIGDEISWTSLVPDFLVFIFPLVGGIILLVKDFSWILLGLLLVLLVLSFGGNAFIRSSFACKYCRQRELGCPAEKMFGSEKR